MEDLFEQLDRMKDLMVYENGMSIDEVSTSRGNIPTPDTKTDNTKEKKEGGNEETKPSTETTKSEGENCFLIKASGEFVVNVNKGSKAVSNFITNLENSIKNSPSFDRSKVKDGSMYITEITLQGFASNYYNGAVEPDFDNGWCKKWDKRGGLYDGLCTDWEIKPFSGKKKSSYSGNKTTNQKLASDRAVNAYNALKEKYISHNNIILLDAIYDINVLNLIRSNCKIYVHGHSVGGTNPTLVEAMYVGLPILAYDVDFNRETTQNKVLYFKNIKQLQNNAELLLNDGTLRKKILENVKKIAKDKYNWERIINKYDSIL